MTQFSNEKDGRGKVGAAMGEKVVRCLHRQAMLPGWAISRTNWASLYSNFAYFLSSLATMEAHRCCT